MLSICYHKSVITYSSGNVSSLITSNLNGKDSITFAVGSTYTEPVKPVIVQEDLLDVTLDATIKKTITDKDNNVVEEIDTSTTGTYIITYDVTYKNHHNVLKKTITIE